MARSTSDEEIKLRKRARRRLIGAIALATLMVVALPMVLDNEPRPIGGDIDVQMPSPSAGPYGPAGNPAGAPLRQSPAAAPGQASDAPTTRAQAKPAEAARPAPGSAAGTEPANAPAQAPAPAAAAPVPAKASGAIASAATPADARIEIAGAPVPAPAAAKPAAPAPAAVKAPAQTPVVAAPAAKGQEDVTADAGAAAGAAGAAEAAKVAAAAKAAKATKGTETYVIQLGAFAEVDRAKDRHARLVKAGVRAYTEVIKTPTGDKTRVRAGPFPTREAADKVNAQLKALGISDGVVVARRY